MTISYSAQFTIDSDDAPEYSKIYKGLTKAVSDIAMNNAYWDGATSNYLFESVYHVEDLANLLFEKAGMRISLDTLVLFDLINRRVTARGLIKSQEEFDKFRNQLNSLDV